MSLTVKNNPLLVEEFLENALKDIVDMGQELFFYAHNPSQEGCADSLFKKIRKIKEDSGRLNFKKMEEVFSILDSILYYVGINKISMDEKFIHICQQAGNLSCDILKSIKLSGLERSKNYRDIVGDMTTYLESNVIKEHLHENEDFNVLVKNIQKGECERGDVKASVGSTAVLALGIESGGTFFCVEQKHIISIERMEASRIEHRGKVDFYRCQEEALPIMWINKFFNLPERASEKVEIIFLKIREYRFGIIVDKTLSSEKVIVKNLGIEFSGQEIYRGAAIIKKGKIGLALNVTQLYQTGFGGRKLGLSKKQDSVNNRVQTKKQIIVFELENKKSYGIPIAFIDRIEKIMKKNVEWSGEQAVVRIGKRILPIVNFKLSSNYDSEEVCCLVMNINGGKKGLIIKNAFDVKDEMISESEKSIKIINPEIFLNKTNDNRFR